jgi:hypothetical protein
MFRSERRETLTVPVLQAINKSSLFQKNPTLLTAPYRVRSSVMLSIFRDFVSELERAAVNITDTNFTGVQRLCEEFGFDEFGATYSKSGPRWASKEPRMHAGESLPLKKRGTRLQNEFGWLSTDFGRLAGDVSALRSDVSALNSQIAASRAVRPRNGFRRRSTDCEGKFRF